MSLDRTAAGEILGIEVKHHPFPGIIFQTHPLTILGWQGELRRRSPNLRRRPCESKSRSQSPNDHQHEQNNQYTHTSSMKIRCQVTGVRSQATTYVTGS